jgi:hypothetical protein
MYPEYPIPDLIEVQAGEVVVLDERARVEAKMEKKKRDVAEYNERSEELRLKLAQEALLKAEENLKKLKERTKSP